MQALFLEVAPVVGINQEVNLTAVLLPLNPNLTVFYWWIGHSLQVCWPRRSPQGGEWAQGTALGPWGEVPLQSAVRERQAHTALSSHPKCLLWVCVCLSAVGIG